MAKGGEKELVDSLRAKAAWVKVETLRLHGRAPETRLASSLSDIEIFTALFYGGLVRFDPRNVLWEGRDRVIVSKGHGAVSMYPILADLGYFPREELQRVCKEGSFLGCIPDPVIPGFETVNGSLGHGLGVGCGMAMGLKGKGSKSRVFVLVGDGELYEGSIWEAVMIAPQLQLDNLVLIVDRNRVSMLDFCDRIIDLEPLDRKFREFKWITARVDGHDVGAVHGALKALIEDGSAAPKALIADTIKGKGVPRLETDALSHIKNLDAVEIEALIKEIECGRK